MDAEECPEMIPAAADPFIAGLTREFIDIPAETNDFILVFALLIADSLFAIIRHESTKRIRPIQLPGSDPMARWTRMD
jgi:hypothetical protein